MAEKKLSSVPPRPGIPSSEQSLKEYYEGFRGFEESIAELYKQQSQSLTKRKKCATVKVTKQTKEKRKCENSSSTRKKPLKK